MTTFRRLLGFLRPYRRSVIGSLVFAWLAMGMTVFIPWLVGQTVNAIEPPPDKGAILPLVLAIGGAGILRLGATPQVIENLLAAFLTSYRRSHPGIEVRLVEDGGARLPDRLSARRTAYRRRSARW